MPLRSLVVIVSAVVLSFSIALAAASSRQRPSIVLISIDTLRADHLSSYGYNRRTSPAIDAVAARGVLFERACVPQPQTSPSHASMLTGVTPWKHGVLTNGFRMSDAVDRLPSALRRIGYDTAGVVAVPHLGSSRGFAAGFNNFSEPSTLKTGDVLLEHRRGGDLINAEARRFIDGHVAKSPAAPMFLFVHYFDCHFPYRSWDSSEDQKNAYAPEQMAQTAKQLQRYDDGVTYTDRHVGELLNYVKAKLGDNVVVVITADHGEQIGDHELNVGHADIYRETVRVPVIIAGPGIEQARITTRVSTMDIPVTLASLAGARLQNALDGIDLGPIIERGSSLLRRIFSRDAERSFVVTGAPTYSRSIALLQGDAWYIRNFDSAYRYAQVSQPAPADGAPTKVLKGQLSEGQMVYTVAVERYQPFWVTLQHELKSPQCAATARVTLEPGMEYFRQPAPFRQSLRVTVPAARNDVIRLEISPAACAGRTLYAVAREAPATATATPDFFGLLVARRLRNGDELYDVGDDPLMRRNVLGTERETAKALDGELEALFKRSATAGAPQRIPLETLQALRSLGYL